MSRITTHVLDTARGRPAAGIAVRLEKQQGGGWSEVNDATRAQDVAGAWVEIARGTTDADGRCKDLASNAGPGTYRLTFETGAYFAQAGRASIYPEISIAFLCSGDEHYHLPLLLSDNSYTTYRGS
jgi:5-hydroxyisourate hydrolase